MYFEYLTMYVTNSGDIDNGTKTVDGYFGETEIPDIQELETALNNKAKEGWRFVGFVGQQVVMERVS